MNPQDEQEALKAMRELMEKMRRAAKKHPYKIVSELNGKTYRVHLDDCECDFCSDDRD